MTQLVGIFGYPIGHSVSPAFQQAALDHYSLPARYYAWSVPPERLEAEVSKLRGPEYLGANVTAPHKERVGAYLDQIDPWAQTVGAVNTLVNEDGRLVGYNADADGLIRCLKEMGGFEPRGTTVLLLGAGGGARAAAFGLARENVASLTIANRTLERAEALAGDVERSIASVSAIPLSGPGLDEASGAADLIVNCTSLGMSHGEAEAQTPLEAGQIPSGALVYDIVYNPPDTPLLLEAQKAGARTLRGLPMLIYQGAVGFERWTGREAPIGIMFRAGERALARLSAQG